VTIGVLLFPGTNCEQDVVEAVCHLGGAAEIVWHGDRRLPSGVDGVVVPGGFAHGDYLRTGAIARFSPIMTAVRDFARSGGPVIGICNGFQILCESGLLPGALQKNRGLKFLCTTVEVRVETGQTAATGSIDPGMRLRLPINHFEGCYTCDEATLRALRSDDRVVLRYVDNPNGSIDDIAGVCSAERNVVGMMPHPERASHPLLGSTDGVPVLLSLLAAAGQDREMPAFLSTAADTPTARHAP
jgi:phosphoribosylformylglycinamidine synthase subunit PurQ / glutaminase